MVYGYHASHSIVSIPQLLSLQIVIRNFANIYYFTSSTVVKCSCFSVFSLIKNNHSLKLTPNLECFILQIVKQPNGTKQSADGKCSQRRTERNESYNLLH